MKTCKICGQSLPEVCMVTKKECYLCILKKWPPKTLKQKLRYVDAVGVRLRLRTPISNQEDALKIVNQAGGLENLQKIQNIIDGKVIPHAPGNTFYQRLVEELSNEI